MRFVRRTLLVLLFLLVIGWIVGWFVGRSIIQSRVVPEILSVSTSGASYSASDYSVRGFPFSYVLTPKDAEVRVAGETALRPSAATSARVSMPGSLYGLITGGPVGAGVSVSGTHELGNGWTLDITKGSTRTNLSSLANFSRNPDWVYDGTDFDLSGLTLAQNGVTVLEIDRMRLDMTLLGNTQGHGYDLDIRGVRGGGDTFGQVPDTFDGLRLRGEIRPEVNSALLAMVEGAAANPFSILSDHGETYAAVMGSQPGFYISDGELTWGNAQLTIEGSIQPVARISSLSGELVLDAQIAGTGVQTLLTQLLREPALRQASPEILAMVGGALSLTSGFGIDLERGSASTLSGTLVRVGPQGASFPLEEFQINGRSLR